MRLVGYGSMALESLRRHHGDDRRHAARSGRVLRHQRRRRRRRCRTPEAAVHTITGWGFPVTVEQMRAARAAPWASRRCSHAPAARRRSRSAWRASSARPSAAGCSRLVPLRDHVRGGVHADDPRCRHARRPLHAAGSARAPLGAARTHVLVPVGALRQRPHRARAGATSSTSASSIRTAASTSCGRCSASPTRCSPPSRCRSRPA